MRAWYLLSLVLAACGDDGVKDTSLVDGDADTDTDADADVEAENPFVTEAHAYYFHHTVGSDTWGWTYSATADDPQGAITIETWLHEEQVVRVLDAGGNPLASYDITCAEGACSGTCWETDDNILHTQVADYTFRFIVVDEDGNRSEPFDVTGEPDPVSGT